MDQVAALHWIQENIREFNGNERNVTILGYGHGAACVNFLMLSPMARGLFFDKNSDEKIFSFKNVIYYIFQFPVIRFISSCHND